MGIGDSHKAIGPALVATVLLGGCGGDLLGHAGADRPDPARQHLSADAATLIERSFSGLPEPVVDVAAWPHASAKQAIPSVWREAAWNDAMQSSAAHSLLRNQIALGHASLALVKRTEPLPAIAASWQQIAVVETASAQASWLDASDPSDDWQQQVDAAPAAQTLVLTHCGVGGVDGLRACLQTVRQRDNTYLALGGLTHRGAVPDALMLLMQQTGLYTRYRWSSAWPAPAVNWLLWLQPLAKHGFIKTEQVAPLRELYADNPLLFDLVLWRTLRLPGTELGLPVEAFAGLPPQNSKEDG